MTTLPRSLNPYPTADMAGWWGKLALFAFLVWTSKAWIYPLDGQLSITVYKPFGQVAFLMGAVATLLTLLFAVHRGKLWLNGISDKLLALTFVIVLASTLVNIPMGAMDPGIITLFIFLLGCLAFRDKYPDPIRLLAPFFFTTMLLSIAVVLLVPGYSLMAGIHEGDWRGLFAHKNSFGEFAAYSLLLTLFVPSGGPVVRFAKLAIGGLALLASGSDTAIIACALACLAATLYGSNHLRLKLALFAFLVVLVAKLLLIYPDLLYAIRQNIDLTFTGRTRIWEYFLPFIQERPWLGWGFESPVIYDREMSLARQVVWDSVRSLHNGYLTLALAGGLLACAAFLAYLVSIAHGASASLRPRLTIAVLVLFCAETFLESASGFTFGIGLVVIILAAKKRDLAGQA